MYSYIYNIFHGIADGAQYHRSVYIKFYYAVRTLTPYMKRYN